MGFVQVVNIGSVGRNGIGKKNHKKSQNRPGTTAS